MRCQLHHFQVVIKNVLCLRAQTSTHVINRVEAARIKEKNSEIKSERNNTTVQAHMSAPLAFKRSAQFCEVYGSSKYG